MLKTIIGLAARLVALAFFAIAVSGVSVAVRTWPNETVMNVFITVLMVCAGIALWFFGTVMFGQARDERQRRGGVEFSGPSAEGEQDASGGARHDARTASSGAAGEAGGSRPGAAAGAERTGVAPPGLRETAGRASGSRETRGAGRAVAAPPRPAAGFESLTPEDLIGDMATGQDDRSDRESGNGEGETAGVADLSLKDLPELRQALADAADLEVRLVRQANGFGRDPKLVVLLGWTPIAELQPEERGYRALVGHAGSEGRLAVSESGGTLRGHLDMGQ